MFLIIEKLLLLSTCTYLCAHVPSKMRSNEIKIKKLLTISPTSFLKHLESENSAMTPTCGPKYIASVMLSIIIENKGEMLSLTTFPVSKQKV